MLKPNFVPSKFSFHSSSGAGPRPTNITALPIPIPTPTTITTSINDTSNSKPKSNDVESPLQSPPQPTRSQTSRLPLLPTDTKSRNVNVIFPTQTVMDKLRRRVDAVRERKELALKLKQSQIKTNYIFGGPQSILRNNKNDTPNPNISNNYDHNLSLEPPAPKIFSLVGSSTISSNIMYKYPQKLPSSQNKTFTKSSKIPNRTSKAAATIAANLGSEKEKETAPPIPPKRVSPIKRESIPTKSVITGKTVNRNSTHQGNSYVQKEESNLSASESQYQKPKSSNQNIRIRNSGSGASNNTVVTPRKVASQMSTQAILNQVTHKLEFLLDPASRTVSSDTSFTGNKAGVKSYLNDTLAVLNKNSGDRVSSGVQIVVETVPSASNSTVLMVPVPESSALLKRKSPVARFHNHKIQHKLDQLNKPILFSTHPDTTSTSRVEVAGAKIKKETQKNKFTDSSKSIKSTSLSNHNYAHITFNTHHSRITSKQDSDPGSVSTTTMPGTKSAPILKRPNFNKTKTTTVHSASAKVKVKAKITKTSQAKIVPVPQANTSTFTVLKHAKKFIHEKPLSDSRALNPKLSTPSSRSGRPSTTTNTKINRVQTTKSQSVSVIRRLGPTTNPALHNKVPKLRSQQSLNFSPYQHQLEHHAEQNSRRHQNVQNSNKLSSKKQNVSIINQNQLRPSNHTVKTKDKEKEKIQVKKPKGEKKELQANVSPVSSTRSTGLNKKGSKRKTRTGSKSTSPSVSPMPLPLSSHQTWRRRSRSDVYIVESGMFTAFSKESQSNLSNKTKTDKSKNHASKPESKANNEKIKTKLTIPTLPSPLAHKVGNKQIGTKPSATLTTASTPTPRAKPKTTNSSQTGKKSVIASKSKPLSTERKKDDSNKHNKESIMTSSIASKDLSVDAAAADARGAVKKPYPQHQNQQQHHHPSTSTVEIPANKKASPVKLKRSGSVPNIETLLKNCESYLNWCDPPSPTPTPAPLDEDTLKDYIDQVKIRFVNSSRLTGAGIGTGAETGTGTGEFAREEIIKFNSFEYISNLGALCFFQLKLDRFRDAHKTIEQTKKIVGKCLKHGSLQRAHLPSFDYVWDFLRLYGSVKEWDVHKEFRYFPEMNLASFSPHFNKLGSRVKAGILGLKSYFYGILRLPLDKQIEIIRKTISWDSDYFEWYCCLQKLIRSKYKNQSAPRGFVRPVSPYSDPTVTSSQQWDVLLKEEITSAWKSLKLAPNNPRCMLGLVQGVSDLLRYQINDSKKYEPIAFGLEKFLNANNCAVYVKDKAKATIQQLPRSVDVNLEVADIFTSWLPPRFRDYKLGKECIDRCLKYHPMSSEVNFKMGQYYLNVHSNFAQAEAYFDTAFALDERNYKALVSLLHLMMRTVVSRQELILEVIRLQLENSTWTKTQLANFRYLRGLTLLGGSNPKDAFKEFIKAYQLCKKALNFVDLPAIHQHYGWPGWPSRTVFNFGSMRLEAQVFQEQHLREEDVDKKVILADIIKTISRAEDIESHKWNLSGRRSLKSAAPKSRSHALNLRSLVLY